MILQALTAYYEQLVRQDKLSAPGWDDSFKVSYELRLNDAGQLGFRARPAHGNQRWAKRPSLPRVQCAYQHTSNARPVFRQTCCAIIPPICWVQTKKASRSVQSSASMPVRRCTTGCWTMLTAPQPGDPCLF